MAYIFTKSTIVGNENGLIQDYREGFRYPFKIADWTRAKVAIGWSYTASQDNSDLDGYGAASITTNTAQDRMFFGLKKYNENFPEDNDSEYFVGLSSSGPTSSIQFPQSAFSTATTHGETMHMGVRHPDGTFSGSTPVYNHCSVDAFDTGTNFIGLLCLDLTILNKGQSNQKITFKYSNQTITDTSKANIESVMNAASYTNVGDLDFNFNGMAYDLPDTFFMYLPFGNIRMRVFALDIVRVS